MKLLQQMLLINWHFIVHQTIDFRRLNFLTGKTGTGKSTIIDALQVLVLGDTSGTFFNKAANDQSRRTLKGYLQGEIAENEAEGVVYLRQGKNFSSYIVGEFYDTTEKKSFCLGIIFNSYADGGKEEHRFFYLNGELPAHNFILNNVPLDIKTLREWATGKLGRNNFRYFDSNATYREHFRHLMGGLGEKFFSLFRKAVPFSPIMDIQDFIAKFVCNVPAKVEIEDMRENIRYYKQLEGELDLVKRRITALDAIEKQYAAFYEEDNRLLMHRFLVERAELEMVVVSIDRSKERYKAWQRDLAELEANLKELERLQLEMEESYQQAVNERARCEAQQQKDYLDQQLRQLREKLDSLNDNQTRLKSLLKQYAVACGELKRATVGLDAYSQRLNYENIHTFTDQFWLDFQGAFQMALNEVREETFKIKTQLDQSTERAGKLRAEIAQLKQGIKAYDKSLVALIEAISAELSKGGSVVRPRVFADLLEIKTPRWRDAIEGYLHTQKFYLLIEPQYFIGALRVYDRLKFERNFYDLGLVDVEKLLARARPPRPGSLAEEIWTDDPYARAYANYLLGGVMEVERIEDLRRFPTAITPTCMLYKNYVARQINPERFAIPYIGKKSIEEQIRIKENALGEQEREIAHLTSRLESYGRLALIPDLRDDDLERIKQFITEKAVIPAVIKSIEELTSELGRLDLSKVYDLNEKIRFLEKEKDSCAKKKQDISNQAAIKEENLKRLAQETIPHLEENLLRHQARLRENYPDAWQTETGEPRFQGELSRLGQPDKISANFSSQLARTESQRDQKWEELVKLRSSFNRDFRGTNEVTAVSNEAWQGDLQRLIETSLPAYEEKIREAREKAQREFQEDFISKLRQNIEVVREQIDELNKALKDVPFGRSKYRFKVTANNAYREYYDMIMDELLVEGFTLFSNEFQIRYQPVVDQLFNQIVATAEAELSPEQREELEKNLRKFTDYRTYLDFELLEIDEDGRESRLSKTISKKSGGETQTPFYIAVLASFLQTYRVSQSNHNNTLRLVVFDEAFSKMDHQRIHESIKLLRDVGLQVIVAAPTDNIADIAPLVDRNLCVTRVRQQTVVKAFDPQEIEA
ncbi:MAG: ATP-binding protein [Bacillota bacterium]